MKGFFLGILVAALAYGVYAYWNRMNRHPAPAVHGTPDAGPPKEAHERKRRRRHGATRVARGDGPGDGAGSAGENEPEPVKLSPSDLKLVSQGDDLSRPDVIHL